MIISPEKQSNSNSSNRRSAWSKSQDKSQYLSINDIADILEVDSPEKAFENHHDDGVFWGSAYDYAMKNEGKTDEEARAFADKSEELEYAEAFDKYENAVIYAAGKIFGYHHLMLEPAYGKQYGRYHLSPSKSWNDAANKIRETINGYGEFYFSSTKEFLLSGPWTARQAVMQHLGWMKYYPTIYGETGIKTMIERHLR